MPNKLIEGSWLRVPQSWVDNRRLRAELKLPNESYWSALQTGQSVEGLSPHIKLWRKKNKYYYVPRHYELPLNDKGKRLLQKQGGIKKRRPKTKSSSTIECLAEPRNKVQVSSVEALVRDRKDKILALGCGAGKTVCSIIAAVRAKRFPVLIVVNTNALMDQWEDRIKQFLKINGKTPVVGRVQGPKCDWEGFDISVAMLHSLVMRKYPKDFFSYWKLLVFDEAHRLGADLFSKACPMFQGERWGLTATLKRPDGMDKVIQFHLGKVAFEFLDQPLKPIVYFVQTGESFDDKRFRLWGGKGRISLARLINHVCGMERRNEFINKWVHKAAVEQNRTILVLGERVGQLEKLHELCSCTSKALHVGSMSQEERKDALSQQVVFATQHLAKEALDCPAFDTLLILFPFSGEGRFRQSTGRILREVAGKKKPKVLVFVDDCSIIRSMVSKMQQNARKLGFKTKVIR